MLAGNAQVPANGMAADNLGNIYLGLHAPDNLTYDDLPLPTSRDASTYVLKLDSDGNLLAIKPIKGGAEIAGELIFSQDSVFFVQGHFYATASSKGKSELVFTKLSSDLEYQSSVTQPLPLVARPTGVAYANNRWYSAYFEKSEGLPNRFVLVGLNHRYEHRWLKTIKANQLGSMWMNNDGLHVIGTFYYQFQLQAASLTSTGVDLFHATLAPKSGDVIDANSTSTNQIVSANATEAGEAMLTCGGKLEPSNEENQTRFFVTQTDQDLNANFSYYATDGGNSEATAVCRATDGANYAAGNFTEVIEIAKNTFTSYGKQDVILVKASAEGKPKWIKAFGSVDDDELLAIAAMPDGGVVLAYQAAAKDYGCGMVYFDKKAPQHGQVVIVCLDGSGQIRWTKHLLGTYN